MTAHLCNYEYASVTVILRVYPSELKKRHKSSSSLS